jgi:hypothetical protein
MAYMLENGFNVEEIPVEDAYAIKLKYQIPATLHACHTAIVDGYVIEGHVSAAEITRLLAERPDVVGLAVPGMPIGSPGMEAASGEVQPYEVFTFDKNGNTEVYARYGR